MSHKVNQQQNFEPNSQGGQGNLLNTIPQWEHKDNWWFNVNFEITFLDLSL